jgi:hypothetical protein
VETDRDVEDFLENHRVSAAGASRGRTLERKRMARNRVRSGAAGARSASRRTPEVILALVDETRDMTLEELRAALADQGLEFGAGKLCQFFDRRGITLKGTLEDRHLHRRPAQHWQDPEARRSRKASSQGGVAGIGTRRPR